MGAEQCAVLRQPDQNRLEKHLLVALVVPVVRWSTAEHLVASSVLCHSLACLVGLCGEVVATAKAPPAPIDPASRTPH